jgi:ketosteroid isomerase-like protein
MRIRFSAITLSLTSCLWLTVVPLVARQESAQTRPAEEAEHEALRQLKSLYEQSIRDGKPEALAPHLAPEFHGVMVTGRVVNSLDDLRKFWTDMKAMIGEGGTYTTTINPERSVIIGDLALARGSTADVVVTSAGKEFRFTSYWTATLQKDQGVWKIRQMQGSIDPVDNAFVREFTRRALMLTGGIAGAIGLVLGAGVVLIFTRRRTAKAQPR